MVKLTSSAGSLSMTSIVPDNKQKKSSDSDKKTHFSTKQQ